MSRTGDDPHHAADHEHVSELSETQLRVRALESILVEKGYVDPAALDVLIEAHENQIGPHNGAGGGQGLEWIRLPAVAVDRQRCGDRLAGLWRPSGEAMVALENTVSVHNLVVHVVLVLPGAGAGCRRVVQVGALPLAGGCRSAWRPPRLGVELPADTEVRVWDSTAEVRYLVLPMRPAGTDGWGGGACPSSHAGFDDRGRLLAPTGRAVMNGAHDMGGVHGFGGGARAGRAGVSR